MIDVTKPVRLLRMVNLGGNIYHPREYGPGELPGDLLVEGIVTQEKQAIASFIPQPGAFEVTEIKIGVQEPGSEATVYGIIPPPVVVKPRVQINQETVEVLSNLSNVTVSIAKKIVEERVKAPFKDVTDLDLRAPLNKGVKWETLQERLLFD